MAKQQHAVDYQETLPVHFLRTRNGEGELCYFVIRASHAHLRRLLAKKGTERVDISEYGEILASGYGERPEKRILAMLKARYGIELDLDEE